MTPAVPAPHVVVVGGGVLGASAAAHLTQLSRGRARVTLVTSGALADGASGRSLAWLNSSGDRSPAYHRLRLMGLDRYRTRSARHPASRRYLRFDGALKWAGEGQSLRETFAFERARGYDAHWVEPDEAARLAPVRAAMIAAEGAIFNPGEGWVSLPDLVGDLVREATGADARVIEHAGRVRVDVRRDEVVGVVLEDGSRIAADRVVLASGAHAPSQLATLGVTVPDAAAPAVLVTTTPVDPGLVTVLNTARIAMRPTPDGRLVIGAGWAEKSLALGADGAVAVPESTVAGLLAEASRVLVGSLQLDAHRVGAGLKPIPGDGEPVVGAVHSVSGLHVLFTHSGATLGLILGELIAEEVLTGAVPPVLATFGVGRFADRAAGGAAPDADTAGEPALFEGVEGAGRHRRAASGKLLQRRQVR